MSPEPTIDEFLTAASKAVRGSADPAADYLRGSDYEVLSGPCAVIWSREAQRDTDLFRAIRFNDANGDNLTDLVWKRFAIERGLETKGRGTVTLERSPGGIAGTIWAGTRIRAEGGPAGTTKYFRVLADRLVTAPVITVALDVECTDPGPGSKIDASTAIYVDDPLWDSTWKAKLLRCADGTLFEPADEFRARVRRLRRDRRVGHEKAIVDACKAAGAANVAIFRSDYGGDLIDFGLNVCYVGDSGHTATPSLLRACVVALHGVRVLGDHLQVLPMQRQTVDVDADVTLNVSPTLADTERMRRIHSAAIAQYLGGLSGRWNYSRIGLQSAITRPTPEVQTVSFSAPTSDTSILVGSSMPATLNRYIPGTISLRYLAP